MEEPIEAKEPIYFNGEPLPLAVYWMELLGPILKGLPKPIEEWLLDLHYCGGINRQESSIAVLQYCSVLRQQIHDKECLIISELRERLPSAVPERIISEWDKALIQIQRLANSADICKWTRRSFVKQENAAAMLDYLEKHNPDDQKRS